MAKDYKEYYDEDGMLREFPFASKMRERTKQFLSDKSKQELVDLQEVIVEKAAAGEYIIIWYDDLQYETVKFLESLDYKVTIDHDGMNNKYYISWEEEE